MGVRELRQNLSVYLDRVKAGESLEVTEHGLPVAQLRPLGRSTTSRLDELIAAGRARRVDGDPLRTVLLEPAPGRTLLEVLRDMREEERP